MKIDNKLFTFLFQKKKKGASLFPILLCVILLCGSFGSGLLVGKEIFQKNGNPVTADAGSVKTDAVPANSTETENHKEDNTEEEFVDGNYVLSTTLASMTMDKYKDAVSPYGYTYGEAITGLSRTDNIVLRAGFAVEDMDFEYWTELVNLYADPELTDPVGSCFAYDQGSREITISPSNYPFGQIYVSGINRDIVGQYIHDDIVFFPQNSGSAWGNLNTMYLASYVDLETGEKLDVPQVQVVSMKGELEDTPRLAYTFTDDGRVTFNWSSVEGAAEYFVCRYQYSEEYGSQGGLSYIASTKDTTWTADAPEYGAVTANYDFMNYEVAENDWYSYSKEDVIAQYGADPIYIFQTDDRDFYCVIAISEAGTSMMSNTVDILSLQDSIPVEVAYDTWLENGFSYSGYESVDDLNAYAYVTMANGMTAMKLIDYDTEKAVTVEDRYITADEDFNYISGENVNILKIPYTIEGTPFEDIATVVAYDNSNLEKDLALIEDRENKLRKRAGEITLDNDISFIEHKEDAPKEVREVDLDITANTALSEYLAINMLAGVEIIDVSEFKEASDISLLEDALMEAYYQNPYILGISGYQINNTGTALKIEYEESPSSQAMKQQKIKEKAESIVADIITPDMTELEKELAINQYLCDTISYSYDALDNAEANDYAYVDESFNDCFSAYGAIVDGDCVCAGYAAAFKILADLAGLDSVVVTGNLDGNLPHAWNKVRIDGEWEILDVTNNDNDTLSNALFNLPDEAGSRTLTECNDYVMDGYMRNYAATNGQREFYRMNDLYFDYDEIAQKLADQLNDKGVALLRTEYALDDTTFNTIAQEVYSYIGEANDLYGYYWMGVIYLTTSPIQ